MNRLCRNEILGIVAAAIAAGVTYQADIKYLPSIFLIVAGILMLGVFADLEDNVLNRKFDEQGIESHNWHVVLVRFVRTIVLLAIGVLIFAALARQF